MITSVSPAIIARAEATTAYVVYTFTSSGIPHTTTVALGNDPTPAPVASSSPSNGAVVGAVVGSLIGFIVLLVLIGCWIRSRNPDWAPYLSSSRSSFSSVYVHNPNALPTLAATQDLSATTRVVRDTETRTFFFTRPSRKRESETSRGYHDTETSASSESSDSSRSSY
jgi:hypothetical protein